MYGPAGREGGGGATPPYRRLLQRSDKIVNAGHGPDRKTFTHVRGIIGAKAAGPQLAAVKAAKLPGKHCSIARTECHNLFVAFAQNVPIKAKKKQCALYQSALSAHAACSVATPHSLIQLRMYGLARQVLHTV